MFVQATTKEAVDIPANAATFTSATTVAEGTQRSIVRESEIRARMIMKCTVQYAYVVTLVSSCLVH